MAGHGPKAHISVTIDFEALKAATATATGELVFGGTLSAAAIRRLACDAEVLPIVLGSKSQPLDVGTSERFVTRAMRQALNARDKGCVVCGAPPIQCEAHHLIHWIDGGITAVSTWSSSANATTSTYTPATGASRSSTALST
ncbi:MULTISPECIES: HNH endonuclease signature motif containing protein [unclassified Kribbella]|uniref:HNH endonuclease signature motif containing protein n=1 Tax=unclassified Kribbella TaxID=2644121 RepID=UPI0030181CCA